MPTAFVTGVSRGFGLSLCHSLRAAGYRVLGAGMSPDPGPAPVDDYRVLDLRAPLGAEPYAAAHVDVLVSNAGVYLDDPRRGYGDLFALSPDDLEATFQVNVFAATRLVQWYAPAMLARGTGRLVCVTSGMGRLRDSDGASFAYRSSKLALNALVLAVACHFGAGSDGPPPGDLSAFAVCPGWIRTDMGTTVAPHDPQPAADALVGLLDMPPERTNGRLFRDGAELSWDRSSLANRSSMEHSRET